MSRLTDGSRPPVVVSGSDCVVPAIGELTAWFARWFEQHEGREDLWPAFDRWVRDSLNQFLGARRVRCFAVTAPQQRLTSLTSELDDAWVVALPAHGLVDHVVASGRRYVRGQPGNEALIERLAREWESGIEAAGQASTFRRVPDWLLPIRDRNRTTGLVIAGELPDQQRGDLPMLQAVGHLVEMFWRHVEQGLALAAARRTDQASGVLNRIDLVSLAGRVLNESASEGEPAVVLALAVEGVRRLDDDGQWQLRDWLMRQVGLSMRRKLRSDDLVGRFSDDRFVAVLRRLDISLGHLIARKLLETVNARVSRQSALHDMIRLRCGLAEASNEEFEPVLARAFRALEQARIREKPIELDPRPEPMAAATDTEVVS